MLAHPLFPTEAAANASGLAIGFPQHPDHSTEEVVIDASEEMDSFGLRSVALLARMVGDRGVLLRYPQDPVLRVLELLDVEAIPGVRIERW